MNSMTGFGRAEAILGHHTVVVEISAVNRRNLEVSLSLPKDWQDLDPEIQLRLKARILRGRIFFSLKVTAPKKNLLVTWDKSAVSAALTDLKELAESNNVPFEPDPSLLYRIATVQSEGSLPLWKDHQDILFQAIDSALDNFLTMRGKEGDAMQVDILKRISILGRIVAQVTPLVPRQAPTYRESLLKRIKESGLELDLDDERVLKEISIFAEKCDVSEELTRLCSHLEQMDNTAKEKGAIGRKIEFLLQEVFREFNTLGNKSSDLEIIQAVLEAKSEVEKLREQALNVE